jgi:deoxyribonuclease V
LRLDRLITDQQNKTKNVKICAYQGNIATVAGADVAQQGEFLFACIGVFSFPRLSLLGDSYACLRASMPYIPGFLSYRELPVIVKAYRNLKVRPDIMLIDGQGIAHPRGLGLATHLGVVLDTPTIGCAKSHLYGEYRMPGAKRGAHRAMRSGHQRIGVVLRTRNNVKPLYVSPGHLVDIHDCMRIVLRVARRYRLPEPIRYAHKMAGMFARQKSGKTYHGTKRGDYRGNDRIGGT